MNNTPLVSTIDFICLVLLIFFGVRNNLLGRCKALEGEMPLACDVFAEVHVGAMEVVQDPKKTIIISKPEWCQERVRDTCTHKDMQTGGQTG